MSRLFTPPGEPEWHRQFRINLEGAMRSARDVATYAGSVPDNAYLLLVNAGAAPVTVNLPAAAAHRNRVLNIKKTDSTANAVTIDGNGAETIDGAATTTLTTQWQSKTLLCDGTTWFLI